MKKLETLSKFIIYERNVIIMITVIYKGMVIGVARSREEANEIIRRYIETNTERNTETWR